MECSARSAYAAWQCGLSSGLGGGPTGLRGRTVLHRDLGPRQLLFALTTDRCWLCRHINQLKHVYRIRREDHNADFGLQNLGSGAQDPP